MPEIRLDYHNARIYRHWKSGIYGLQQSQNAIHRKRYQNNMRSRLCKNINKGCLPSCQRNIRLWYISVLRLAGVDICSSR